MRHRDLFPSPTAIRRDQRERDKEHEIQNRNRIYAASYDTPADLLNVATHFRDGTSDEVDVTAAAGGKCWILKGTYNVQSVNAVSVQSNTEIYIDAGAVANPGAGVIAAIFTNPDQVHGNTDIKIHGPGLLNGNRGSTTSGDQFAVNFINVRKSTVDTYIDNFRNFGSPAQDLHLHRQEQAIRGNGQNGGSIESFDVAGSAQDWVWVTPPTSATVETTGQAVGAGALKVVINKNVNSTLNMKKWVNAGIERDLRYRMLSSR